MSDFHPTQTSEPAQNREGGEVSLPTRFGRGKRPRRAQPEPATRADAATAEPRLVDTDERPFEDHGGL